MRKVLPVAGLVLLILGAVAPSPSSNIVPDFVPYIGANQNLNLGVHYVVPRVVPVVIAATTFTPNSDVSDQCYANDTDIAGILTMAADTGAPVDGRRIIFRIKSTNVQTYAWNAQYASGTDVVLPLVTSGGGKTDVLGFLYDGTLGKWTILALARGY